MAHPRKNFKIRQYIASKSILRLTIDFIAINAGVALVFALCITLITKDYSSSLDYAYYMYIELFGKEPNWEVSNEPFIYNNIKAFLATISLLSPALFLGAIVYKFFVLKRDNLVFRSKCDLSNGDGYLKVYFYISSDLEIRDLRFTAFIRIYESKFEEDRDEYFPMNTIPVELEPDSYYPLPFNYVPGSFRVPIKFNGGSTDGASDISIDLKDDILILKIDSKEIKIDSAKGDFCHLFLVGSGDVPDLQSSFKEAHKYNLFEDISKAPLPKMKTSFKKKTNSFFVHNWPDF